jgi:hypothetical protein
VGRYGYRSRFAINVGELLCDSGSLRRVDVLAGDHWLTCDDNSVYVPHFIGCLQWSIKDLLRDPKHRRGRPFSELSVEENYRRLDTESDNTEFLKYRFMDWGPTADNVQMLLFREAGTAFLPFSFWRPNHHDPADLGQVFVAELREWELAAVLHDAACELIRDWAARRQSPEPTEPGSTSDSASV